MKLGAKRAELMQKFVHEVASECLAMNAPDPPHWTLNCRFLVCFVLFGSIEDRLVALRNSVQNGPNKCESSCHVVVPEFFATNAPDPPH